MPTIKEEIKRILEQFENDTYSIYRLNSDKYICEKLINDLVNSSINSILEIVKKGMPSKKTNICEFDPRVDIGAENKAERKGFNSALTEMERKLKQPKIEGGR